MVRILSVSYDEVLLRTRQMLLEARGYKVASSLGFTDALKHCQSGAFDIFILGHSIPYTDKQELVKTFLNHCSAPVISLRRNPGEELVDGAEYHIEPDPQRLLDLVGKLAQNRAAKRVT